MTFRPFLTAALLALVSTGPALAQDKMASIGAKDIVIASDPQSVVDFFESEGYPARLTEDGVGDPLVEYRANGEQMNLFFYDCKEGVDCQAVQFFSGYRTDDGVPFETLNAWNTERRFIRAYITDDNVTRIEMDVATSQDGVSYRDFGALVSLWLDSVVVFEDHIGW